jgi:hypothetical protein
MQNLLRDRIPRGYVLETSFFDVTQKQTLLFYVVPYYGSIQGVWSLRSSAANASAYESCVGQNHSVNRGQLRHWSQLPELQFWLYHLLAVLNTDLIPLTLSFFTCKMGIITGSASQRFYVD